jgi:leader peptidase (prepilin peptidase)/N-methyltransferase
VWLSALGLVIGSFLNVVIWRLPREESLVKPGSHCPSCERPLRWFENIPLFSWLALRGKCRTCKAKISVRYPMVEVLTALLFLACLVRFDWTWDLARALMLVVLLIPLTFIDLEHWLLPFALTLPGIALGILLSVPGGLEQVRDAAIGAGVGFLGFWAMEWAGAKVFKKEALGGGDKYLLALIGAFLTFRPLLGVVFLSSLEGAVVGIALLAIRGRAGPQAKEDKKPVHDDGWTPGATNIPFGPWLSIAALQVLLLGPWLGRIAPRGVGWLLGVAVEFP